jgi:hypothetical protein
MQVFIGVETLRQVYERGARSGHKPPQSKSPDSNGRPLENAIYPWLLLKGACHRANCVMVAMVEA